MFIYETTYQVNGWFRYKLSPSGICGTTGKHRIQRQAIEDCMEHPFDTVQHGISYIFVTQLGT